MPWDQRVVIVAAALLLMLAIVELVRKRRLREEYSWLWLLAGALIGIAALTPFEFLLQIAHAMGSDNPPAAVFFLGFVAVTFLCLQFSVRLSRMTEQIKNLGQQLALVQQSLEEREQKGR